MLRGLRERDERGVGGWYDVSQLEAYVAVSGEDLVTGDPVPRIGNRSRWGVRVGVYPCAGDDQWVAVRLVDAHDDRTFVAVVGVDPSDDAGVAAFTAGRERQTVADALQRAGLEAFPVFRPEDLVVDPHLRHRGFLIDSVVGGRSIVTQGSPLYELADPVGHMPAFGEHTAVILAELDAIEPASRSS